VIRHRDGATGHAAGDRRRRSGSWPLDVVVANAGSAAKPWDQVTPHLRGHITRTSPDLNTVMQRPALSPRARLSDPDQLRGGLKVQPFMVPYTTSKFAVRAWQAFAAELDSTISG